MKKNLLQNNRGQSLISIMLFVMVLGIIVTLIIASSITDTKRLVVQKSYERAYSLSDSYLSKIISNTGDVFGVSASALPNIVDSNGALSCIYTSGDPETGSYDSYTPASFTCSNAGPNKDSSVSCSRLSSGYGLTMTGVKDKKLLINLDGVTPSAINPAYLSFIFNNTDALLFNFVYERTNTALGNYKTYHNYNFGVRAIGATGYDGMVAINSGIGGIHDYYDVVTGPLKQAMPTGVVNTIINDAIPSDIRDSFFDSLEENSYSLTLDLYKLALNNYTDGVPANITYAMKSISITFLNKEYQNAKYSLAQKGFPIGIKHLDTQFQQTSCKALDSAVSGSGLTSGFGAAELETFRPINKTVAGIFDYALFVGREENVDDLDPIDDGFGSSVIK